MPNSAKYLYRIGFLSINYLKILTKIVLSQIRVGDTLDNLNKKNKEVLSEEKSTKLKVYTWSFLKLWSFL